MNQYHDMFSVSRIPKTGCDMLVKSPDAKHIVILVDSQFHRLEILDNDGALLPKEVIFNSLVKLVYEQPMQDVNPDLSLLSSIHRDDWSEIRTSLEPENKEFFQILDSSLFVATLDKKAPINTDLCLQDIFLSSENRWRDKAIQFVIFSNGQASMLGEHSSCDALMPSRIVDYIYKQELQEKNLENLGPLMPLLSKRDPPKIKTKLSVKVPVKLNENLSKLSEHLKDWVSYIKATILDFRGFGTEEIKGTDLSPDFFGQLSIVLTFFKIEKFKPVIYETASSRKFLHGRTETIRVMSTEAARFLDLYQSWMRNDFTELKREDQLIQAIRDFSKAHLEYTKMASSGLGIDRHFLGLRAMSTDQDSQVALFSEADPCFWKSMNHDLSTSNMSPGTSFYGLGFGPTKPSGYGVNYCLSSGRILYSISAWESTVNLEYPMTQCPRFDSNGNLIGNGHLKKCPVRHEDSRAVHFKRTLEETIWEVEQKIFPHLKMINHISNQAKL